MATLFDLTYQVAVLLGNVREGTVTGAGSGYFEDTVELASLDNDYLNLGTCWVTDTTDDGAPKGEYRVITDFNNANKRVTLRSALSASLAAGDTYAVANSRFPLSLLVQKVNAVIRHMGQVPVTDISITTVDDQREYTLPAAASLDLRRVYVQTNKDSGNYQWQPVLNWSVQISAAETAETLLLSYDLDGGYLLKLVYGSLHGEMRAYDDTLNEVVHPDRVIYQAAADCLGWYMAKTRLNDYKDVQQQLLAKAEEAKALWRLPPLPSRDAKVLIIKSTSPTRKV